jgi:hypothetical protein
LGRNFQTLTINLPTEHRRGRKQHMATSKKPAAKSAVVIRASKDAFAGQRSNSASAIVMGPEIRLTSEAGSKRKTPGR